MELLTLESSTRTPRCTRGWHQGVSYSRRTAADREPSSKTARMRLNRVQNCEGQNFFGTFVSTAPAPSLTSSKARLYSLIVSSGAGPRPPTGRAGRGSGTTNRSRSLPAELRALLDISPPPEPAASSASPFGADPDVRPSTGSAILAMEPEVDNDEDTGAALAEPETRSLVPTPPLLLLLPVVGVAFLSPAPTQSLVAALPRRATQRSAPPAAGAGASATVWFLSVACPLALPTTLECPAAGPPSADPVAAAAARAASFAGASARPFLPAKVCLPGFCSSSLTGFLITRPRLVAGVADTSPAAAAGPSVAVALATVLAAEEAVSDDDSREASGAVVADLTPETTDLEPTEGGTCRPRAPLPVAATRVPPRFLTGRGRTTTISSELLILLLRLLLRLRLRLRLDGEGSPRMFDCCVHTSAGSESVAPRRVRTFVTEGKGAGGVSLLSLGPEG